MSKFEVERRVLEEKWEKDDLMRRRNKTLTKRLFLNTFLKSCGKKECGLMEVSTSSAAASASLFLASYGISVEKQGNKLWKEACRADHCGCRSGTGLKVMHKSSSVLSVQIDRGRRVSLFVIASSTFANHFSTPAVSTIRSVGER